MIVNGYDVKSSKEAALLSKKYNEFTLNFFSYLKDLDPKAQDVSVIILFLIKLTIYIKNLEHFYIHSTDTLRTTAASMLLIELFNLIFRILSSFSSWG